MTAQYLIVVKVISFKVGVLTSTKINKNPGELRAAQPTTRDETQRGTTAPLKSNLFSNFQPKGGDWLSLTSKKKNHPDRVYTGNSYSCQKPHIDKGRRFN